MTKAKALLLSVAIGFSIAGSANAGGCLDARKACLDGDQMACEAYEFFCGGF